MCRRLCTDFVDPTSLQALLSCRLIPLDKNPGVRPIGVGEVLRRIIGKTVTTFIKGDIINAVGPLQLSAGQEGGCESAVHALNKMFEEEDCEAVLLVDATNTFNSLNRATSLLNIQQICPEFAVFIINTYREPTKLYLPGGKHILSNGGTTQGDNCASGFYSLSILPILKELACIACKQIWYADDAAAAGLLKLLKLWWVSLTKVGPGLGYFPNPKKTWLVVKPEFLDEATEIFKDTGIGIATSGQRYLGAAMGSVHFKVTYVKEKVEEWVRELNELSLLAKTEPQLAYAAFIFGLSKRWMYLMRTMEDIAHLYQPLEDCIKNVFLPSFLQFSFSDSERKLFSLPAKYGGLGVFNPTEICPYEFQSSCKATAPLVKMITDQRLELSPEECHDMNVQIRERNLLSLTLNVCATNRDSVTSKPSSLNH